MSDLICPYCFETWSPSIAAFRCAGAADDPKCPRVEDSELGRLTGRTEIQKKVIDRSARFSRPFAPPKGGVLCDCGARTVAVCPNCHHQLPHDYAGGGDRLVGLVGTKASGKSHVIAVLFHELFERVGARYNARVEMLDDETRERVRTEILPRIYNDGVVLESTITAAVDARVRQPLGMRLHLADNKRPINTIFFDTAGEDLATASVAGREARYIGHCGALVLLIDPLQIPAVREAVGSTVELPEQIVDPMVVIRNVTDVLRRESGTTEPKRLSQPVAIALSKIDAIRSLFPGDSQVLAEPTVSGQYDATEGRSISTLLRSHVNQWLGPDFDAFVAANYESFCYFAVSALGSQPEPSGRLSHDVAPHRIADPLLWILSEWRVIPVAK